MIALSLLAVFGYVVGSGPAFDDHRAARVARVDFPRARLTATRPCGTCGRERCTSTVLYGH